MEWWAKKPAGVFVTDRCAVKTFDGVDPTYLDKSPCERGFFRSLAQMKDAWCNLRHQRG